MALRSSFPLERYFFWAVSDTPLGKWRREFVLDPLLFFRQKVHWRNYEAGYDIAELEPASRSKSTYVLQEYFVPIGRFAEFVPRMAEILQRHNVNMINISIRHARADPGSLLAWAREEVFAFVMYYKQGVGPHDRNRVAVWTRELIEAALSVGGTYYLPYQAHATAEQFHRAYPRAREYFALKHQLDPAFRFRNVLWDKYYAPTLGVAAEPASNGAGSEFREVFADVGRRDRFYRFLQNIFHLYPEDRFHWLIQEACARLATDKGIYEQVQAGLSAIKPLLAPLTHALPALKKQKREMAQQTLQLLGDRKSFAGYVEIGSIGRYISELHKHLRVSGPLYVLNEVAPGNGPGDIMERGQLAPIGQFQVLDYQPLDGKGIAAGSIDLVTCFIGLHHAPLELLDGFVKSIHRILRRGGLFILRDHDVRTPEMRVFVSLVHTVFNLGLGVTWPVNEQEFKCFRSMDEWSQYLVERGFRDLGPRLLQRNDPSDNSLMAFVKIDASEVA
jgi:SAM-dependent methyltransferase